MNRSMLWLSLGLLVIAGAVTANNHTMDDGAMDGGAMDGMDDDDDAMEYMPIVWLVVIAAIVFLVAKYGP